MTRILAFNDVVPHEGGVAELHHRVACERVQSPGWVGHLGVLVMSLDKSLKKGGGLNRTRNVLTRAERLVLLQEDDRWTESAGVYNLPKTKYRRLAPGQSGPKRPGASK